MTKVSTDNSEKYLFDIIEDFVEYEYDIKNRSDGRKRLVSGILKDNYN